MDPPLVQLVSLQDRALCRSVPVERLRAAFLDWLEESVLIQGLGATARRVAEASAIWNVQLARQKKKADPRLPWRVIGLRAWSASLPDHPAARKRTGLGTLYPLW